MRWALHCAALLLVACDESGRAPPTPDVEVVDVTVADGSEVDTTEEAAGETTPDYSDDKAAAPAVRRLSARELTNSYQSVLGFVPRALAQVPVDPRDFTFDRVVNAQTVSPIHAEAYDAAAREASETLLGERRLDDIAGACGDALMPPAAASKVAVTSGIGLAAYPDWALNPGDGNPDRLMIRYAEECGVSTSFAAPVDGDYRVVLDVELEPTFDISLKVDGAEVEAWRLTGKHLLTRVVTLAAGSHQVAFDFVYDATANPYVWVQSLAIEGPIDSGADVAGRAACVEALIPALGARAFRRALTDAERGRLAALHAAALDNGGSWAEATMMVVRAILGSPKFLYLIETGEAVGDGRYRLEPWQVAQRLSYALCEGPPDATLQAAVVAGQLSNDVQIAAQAERLMGLPCAAETIARFYRQWLWLERLPQTAKDPVEYPDFSSATAEAFAREADRFLGALTFEEGANVAELFLARHSWVDAVTAQVYGIDGINGVGGGELVRVELPEERRGLLTLPGVLAVTSKFAQTSPVIRGVYVLEQILCDELPKPPDEVDTTPPALDPSATTRERWAAHSESQQCAPCHQRIDPIGFTFEGFDAMGRHRTSENGLPIDARGAAPILGVREPTLNGVKDLAALVAESERATTCLSRQWLRFALGRMEEAPDTASIATVAAALKRGLREGLVALMSTPAFRERVERTEAGGQPSGPSMEAP